ncbi:tetratricopeptide repeat protein [Micromonospora sp. Llam7]|uniref:AfsR/SARP family transcriptional regulator n=1 Tax=Micromonospora tarapacensis TaxID=2835305 RepID=UPI001C830BD6|nr:BTAD domain-containing putative transcriptional regulator [Micromonospora tarapacensis]MBX7264889.1 tetratricopeptide repeat protein [Micromonospora tarapacensis]
MRFGILGPLRVGAGEGTLTAGRDRIVLAVLLLRSGRIVPVDELVDAVWQERPPATARAQLQTCVFRLRQRFAALGIPPETIVTDPVGYGVRTFGGELDAEVFGAEVNAARSALTAGQLAEARRHFRTALALWRGPALDGIASPGVRRRAHTLDERRFDTLEECVDIELRLGLAADLIDELTDAVERQPLRERLRGQLMLALAGVGRQAHALTVYQDGRRLYAEELGIEPGPALQELHQRVLAGDLAVAGPGHQPMPPVRALPRVISDFTGRQETIARLVKEIEEDQARVQLIDGMPGSGKTTLAVHLAARLADRYPDAQLFIDLHGHSARSPLTPAAAVAALLRQLGVPTERIPPDLDDRLAMWRTELTARRALLLLDNAGSADQVTPLLPTGPGCLTLITSRRRLVGLDEGRPSSLPVLDAGEAVELLGRVAGEARVAAEPVAAAEVVRRCGYLPLAIRLAGARLAHRPRWRIADLVERLRDAGDPLAELAAGQRSVGDAFALSYAQVTPAAQRMFRLLGLHPGIRFDNTVAAALAELPLAEAQDVLDELVDAHLVEEPEPGRYRLHDLVREYARTLLDEPGNSAEYRAALERLLDHHLYTAAEIARRAEYPSSRRGFVLPEPPRADLVEVCARQGLSWADENRMALTALSRMAEEEFPRHCWQMAWACWRPFWNGGQIDELTEMHTVGLRAAEALRDDSAVALMLNYLASACYRRAEFVWAVRLLERAVEASRGDVCGEQLANNIWNLGAAHSANGDHRQAIEYFNEASRVLRRLDRRAELTNLNNTTYGLLCWGHYGEALRSSRTHMAVARAAADHRQLANAVGHTGLIRYRMGDTDPARRLLRAGLALHRKVGNRFDEGDVLNGLGMIEREAGRPAAAATLHREALIAMADAGDRIGQCASRNLLARALLDQGDVQSALDLFRRVLRDATKVNHRHQQAQALDGVARCLRLSDPAAARSHWTRALALFRQLDVPDQDEVAALLAALD